MTEKMYLVSFFDKEIYKHCWMYVLRRKYIVMKTTSVIRTIHIKEEDEKKEDGALVENLSSKIDDYVEKERIHFYKNEDNLDMVEMHIDDVYKYEDNEGNLLLLGPFGGEGVSVHLPKDSRPVLVFGQDKAIFRSSQLNESCWTVDRETTLRTKVLGVGLMVSAIVSRSLGWGMIITDNELLEINKLRLGKKYTDEEAASYLNGSDLKKDLVESPFIRYLNYGAGKDRYWTYRHMVL